ncbi:hypothetical protein FKP32DRAFT_1593152 [Trametes sanguinea]|nr:hypothetical protein FKP32DRAFT_1593152 [Trametes sanguinea]
MKFSTVASLLATVAVGVMSVVAQDAAAIISGLNQLTQLSIDTSTAVGSLSVSTAPTVVPTVLNGLGQINSAFNSVITEATLAGVLADQQARNIVSSLQAFVTAQEALLNGLTAEAGLAVQGFRGAILGKLLTLYTDVFTLETVLITTIPTEAGSASVQLDGLGDSYSAVIALFA